jgi:hypothetical protein
VWELWIDRQTGLLLKVIGQVGEDGFFLGGDVGTSAKGGFEIQKLRYNPTFPKRTFSFPPGAFDAGATQRAILAKLPPFRASVAVNNGRRVGSYVDEDWWMNERTWRIKTLVDVDHLRGSSGPDPNDSRAGKFTGAGSFSVMSHGTEMEYDARDHTFARNVDAEQDAGPVNDLLGYLDNIDYSPARCPIVGHERIAGRETDHRRCGLWIDSATGLALRAQVNGHDVLVVRSIEYRPHFPAGIFRFVPPPGSHDLAKLEKNPYYKTQLAPGKPAPNWNAVTLDGKPLPAHRPARQTDPAVANGQLVRVRVLHLRAARTGLPPLQGRDQGGVDRLAPRFLGQPGEKARAAQPAQLPGRRRPKNRSIKTVGSRIPYWLLLDAHGRVIAARIGLQTVAQIEQLLARG